MGQFPPQSLPRGFSHGDYHAQNLGFGDTGDILGIIDWDRWDPHEYLTRDFLHFIFQCRVVRKETSYMDALTDWLEDRETDAPESRWTQSFLQQTGMPSNWKAGAVLAYWADRVACYVGTTMDVNDPWKERNFTKVLPVISRCLRSGM